LLLKVLIYSRFGVGSSFVDGGGGAAPSLTSFQQQQQQQQQQHHITDCEVWLCDERYQPTEQERKALGAKGGSALHGCEAVEFLQQVLLLLLLLPFMTLPSGFHARRVTIRLAVVITGTSSSFSSSSITKSYATGAAATFIFIQKQLRHALQHVIRQWRRATETSFVIIVLQQRQLVAFLSRLSNLRPRVNTGTHTAARM
jgi:hypothetical protein